MKIQVNSDNHVQVTDALRQQVDEAVTHGLKRFSERLTRVEVHLADVDSQQKNREIDHRCTLEGRPAGLQPITVTADGSGAMHALKLAIEKLKSALDSAFGKSSDHKGATSMAGPTNP